MVNRDFRTPSQRVCYKNRALAHDLRHFSATFAPKL